MTDTPEIIINEANAVNDSILLLLALLHSHGGSMDISYEDMDKFEEDSQSKRFMLGIKMDDEHQVLTIIVQEIYEGRVN